MSENPFDQLEDFVLDNNLSELSRAIDSEREIVNWTDPIGRTLLWHAARSGNMEACRLLLLGGADINHSNRSGESALSSAVGKANLHLIQYLLDADADPNIGRPAVSAVNRRDEHTVPILRLLIEHGLNVNQSFAMFGDDSKRRTVLDFAGDGPAADFLRTHGAKTQAELDAAT